LYQPENGSDLCLPDVGNGVQPTELHFYPHVLKSSCKQTKWQKKTEKRHCIQLLEGDIYGQFVNTCIFDFLFVIVFLQQKFVGTKEKQTKINKIMCCEQKNFFK